MGDRVFHALQLLLEQPSVPGREAVARVGQDRQRRLEAVREIAHRPAVALAVLALTLDKTVERTRKSGELPWVVLADVLPLPRLERADAFGHAAHRTQAPTERDDLCHDQQEGGAEEAQRHAAAKAGDLRAEGRLVGQYPERQLRILDVFPDHRVPEAEQARRSGIVIDSHEAGTARWRPTSAPWPGQVDCRDEQGRGMPDHRSIGRLDVGVEPGIRHRQPRIAQFVRELQGVVVLFRRAEEPKDHQAQLLFRARQHARRKGAFEHPAHHGQEGPEHDRHGHHQAGLEASPGAGRGQGAQRVRGWHGGAPGRQAPGANRYPWPRTVRIGCKPPSGSSFLRSRPTNTSRTLLPRSKS